MYDAANLMFVSWFLDVHFYLLLIGNIYIPQSKSSGPTKDLAGWSWPQPSPLPFPECFFYTCNTPSSHPRHAYHSRPRQSHPGNHGAGRNAARALDTPHCRRRTAWGNRSCWEDPLETEGVLWGQCGLWGPLQTGMIFSTLMASSSGHRTFHQLSC